MLLMYEFCYHSAKPKYGEKTKLSYMDTYSFIAYIKADNIYEYISKDLIL